jgi:hypothetical protein
MSKITPGTLVLIAATLTVGCECLEDETIWTSTEDVFQQDYFSSSCTRYVDSSAEIGGDGLSAKTAFPTVEEAVMSLISRENEGAACKIIPTGAGAQNVADFVENDIENERELLCAHDREERDSIVESMKENYLYEDQALKDLEEDFEGKQFGKDEPAYSDCTAIKDENDQRMEMLFKDGLLLVRVVEESATSETAWNDETAKRAVTDEPTGAIYNLQMENGRFYVVEKIKSDLFEPEGREVASSPDGDSPAFDKSVLEPTGVVIAESVTARAANGNLILNDVYYVAGDTPLYSTGTGSTVLRIVANKATVKIVVAAPTNGRYKVEVADAVWGWIAGSAITLAYHYNSSVTPSRANALKRARVAMGFSYWWGHGRWNGATTGGPTPSNRGVCTGDCPSCTHKANGSLEYGADCIHFVDTIWGAGTDTDPGTDGNGCSISQFRNATGTGCVPGKKVTSMTKVKAADVMALTSHIFLVAENYRSSGLESTYECVSCADGCKRMSRNLNTLVSPVAVTRNGW